jgi:hypothetical protein
MDNKKFPSMLITFYSTCRVISDIHQLCDAIAPRHYEKSILNIELLLHGTVCGNGMMYGKNVY